MTDAGLLPYDEDRHGLKVVVPSEVGCEPNSLAPALRAAAGDLQAQAAAVTAGGLRGSWVRAEIRSDGPWAAVVVVVAWVPAAGAFTSTLVVTAADAGNAALAVVAVKLARSRRYGGNARVCLAFAQFLEGHWNPEWGVDGGAVRFLETCQEQPGVTPPEPAPWLVVPPRGADGATMWTWAQACLAAPDIPPQVTALVMLCTVGAARQLAAHPQHCVRAALRLEELSGDCITVPEAFLGVLLACAAVTLLAVKPCQDAAVVLHRVLAKLAAAGAVSTTSKPTARTEWRFLAALRHEGDVGGAGAAAPA